MFCNPSIYLVFHVLDTRYLIEQQEEGKDNNGIKSGAHGLSSLIPWTIGRDCPDDLLALSNGQSMGLRNTGCLKWKTVETMSPI